MRVALSCTVLAYKPPDDDARYPRMTVRDTIVKMTPAQVDAQEFHGPEPDPKNPDHDRTDEPDPELMKFYDTARSICNSIVYEDGISVSPPDVGIEFVPGAEAANHTDGDMQIVCPKLRLAVRHLIGRKDRLNGPFEQLVREVARENEYRCFQQWNGS
jgi:hypothetical protein